MDKWMKICKPICPPISFETGGINESNHVYEYRKILKFGTPQILAVIVLKIEKFDVTLH